MEFHDRSGHACRARPRINRQRAAVSVSDQEDTLAGVATMSGPEARAFWKALMDNASGLVWDAHHLLEADSNGRAQSLIVLAQEELGKALWIYEEFAHAWNHGDETERTVERLREHGRSHIQKYLEAATFGGELKSFWGDYSANASSADDATLEDTIRRLEAEAAERKSEAETAAHAANIAKQNGFYVDRDQDGNVFSPMSIAPGSIEADLRLAAQVIEMLLIRDHTRMKHEADTPYDSTHPQQFRLLPISHPEDWAAASEEFRRGPHETGDPAAET